MPRVHGSQLVPTPALGQQLDPKEAKTIVDISDKVRTSAAGSVESLVRGLIKVAIAITAIVLGVASMHTGAGVLAIYAGVAIFMDGALDLLRAYKSWSHSVTADATQHRTNSYYRGEKVPGVKTRKVAKIKAAAAPVVKKAAKAKVVEISSSGSSSGSESESASA